MPAAQKAVKPAEERRHPLVVDVFATTTALVLFLCAAASYLGGMKTAEQQKVFSMENMEVERKPIEPDMIILGE